MALTNHHGALIAATAAAFTVGLITGFIMADIEHKNTAQASLKATAVAQSTYAALPAPSEPEEPEVERISNGQARVYARNYVEKFLPTPGSAQHQWLPQTKRMPDGSIQVYAYVDAHNLHGALIRYTYIAEMDLDKNGPYCRVLHVKTPDGKIKTIYPKR